MTLRKLSKAAGKYLFAGRLAVKLILAACFAVCLSGCDNGCEQVRESFLHITFSSTKGRKMKKVNALYAGSQRSYSLSLTSFEDQEFDLDPADSVATFTFECTYEDYGDTDTATETLVIEYTSKPKFLDLTCGCSVLYTITNAYIQEQQDPDSPTFFYRAIVTEEEVSTESGTNIKIEY